MPIAQKPRGPAQRFLYPLGVAHTYAAADGARYLIVLTPRLSGLIGSLQADRDPSHQHDIYRRFDSELLESKPG